MELDHLTLKTTPSNTIRTGCFKHEVTTVQRDWLTHPSHPIRKGWRQGPRQSDPRAQAPQREESPWELHPNSSQGKGRVCHNWEQNHYLTSHS